MGQQGVCTGAYVEYVHMDVGCCFFCRFQFQSPKIDHSIQASNGRVARELLAHPEAVHRLWTFKPAEPTYAK